MVAIPVGEESAYTRKKTKCISEGFLRKIGFLEKRKHRDD
jgi:hypothetical protein